MGKNPEKSGSSIKRCRKTHIKSVPNHTTSISKGKGSKLHGKTSGSQQGYDAVRACFVAFTTKELKQLCKDGGLPFKGDRDTLIQNLTAEDQAYAATSDEDVIMQDASADPQEPIPQAEQAAQHCDSIDINQIAEPARPSTVDQGDRPAPENIMAAGMLDSTSYKRKADSSSSTEALASSGEEQSIGHQHQVQQTEGSKLHQLREKKLEADQHDHTRHVGSAYQLDTKAQHVRVHCWRRGVEDTCVATPKQHVATIQAAQALQKEQSEVQYEWKRTSEPNPATDMIDSSCKVHPSDDCSTTQGTCDSSSSGEASSPSGEDEKSRNIPRESPKNVSTSALQSKNRIHEDVNLENVKGTAKSFNSEAAGKIEQANDGGHRFHHEQVRVNVSMRFQPIRSFIGSIYGYDVQEHLRFTEVLKFMCNASVFSIEMSIPPRIVIDLYGEGETRLQGLKDRYISILRNSPKRGFKFTLPVPQCKGEEDALLVLAAASVAHLTTQPFPEFFCVLSCWSQKEKNLLMGVQEQLVRQSRDLEKLLWHRHTGGFDWLRHANDGRSRLVRLAGACSVLHQFMQRFQETQLQNMIRGTKLVEGRPLKSSLHTNPGLKAELCHKPRKTLLEAAFECRGKIAIVNAASGYHAGGGFLTGGRHALEEALCMQSTLYLSLARAVELARKKNLVDFRGRPLHIPERGCILSPGVEVVRDGTNKGYARKDEVVHLACVLSIAMPNKNHGVHDSPFDYREGPEYIKLLRDKFESVINGALQSGADVLVVPDCGCGVFRNQPHRVGNELGCILQRYARCFSHMFLVGSDEFAQATLNSFYSRPRWQSCLPDYSS